MSFDKKIREKLVNHIPKYDSGAWDNFQKLLPSPWYMKLFHGATGWVVGGLSTSALLFTIYSNNLKTELLNGEIATLKEEIENTEIVNSISQTNRVDTVYLTNNINKYIPSTQGDSKNADLAFNEGVQQGRKSAEGDIQYLQTQIDKLRNQQAATDRSIFESIKVGQNASNPSIEPADSKDVGTGLGSKAEESGYRVNEPLAQSEINNPVSANTAENSDSHLSETEPNENGESQSSEKTNFTEPNQKQEESLPEPEEKMEIAILAEPIEVEAPDRLEPENPKKKIKLPKMRLGLTSDYLGLKVFANGPTIELFLNDKLSLNTAALFTGQIETKHQFARDFNRHTGKEFDVEFKRFVNQRPEQIEDISINTSIIKLPFYFNYYLNTWSRFNFIISAGTKLDLSVYQDVGYFSGPLGQQIKRRFEARPKPKTFNNLFYGMGVQYKYRSFVGQMTPYFDFRFRQPDYFIPAKSFGINASLKFEFGN